VNEVLAQIGATRQRVRSLENRAVFEVLDLLDGLLASTPARPGTSVDPEGLAA
jgi:hypothetical protein